MLTANKWCWVTTFIIGPAASIVVYGIFITEAFKENNILRAWTLTFPICEVINFGVYFKLIKGVQKQLHDFHVNDPTWVRIIKETIDSVNIHDFYNPNDEIDDWVKEDVVYDIVAHAAAYRICPKFQLLKEIEKKFDAKQDG